MPIDRRRELWQRRRKGTRKRLSKETRPLLTVFRSNKHMYAQISDPISGRTLTGISTRSPAVGEGLRSTGGVEGAKRVGTAIAKLAKEREIAQVAFNRNGFVYTWRIKALAEAAREAGLDF